ncbi:MAG: aminopeptidase [Candidatus Pacebacteria bacterium]|nr:aminopeptidase [Candidatus Paceibacterota bacterium]PIR61103.1 MAG: hypothetical protein COU68_01275 [Candidatus Pacebacteria bacterium CG10_big_fil_rev_8_21_14_0_10_45_6]
MYLTQPNISKQLLTKTQSDLTSLAKTFLDSNLACKPNEIIVIVTVLEMRKSRSCKPQAGATWWWSSAQFARCRFWFDHITMALQTDYKALQTLGRAIKKKLQTGKKMHITSTQGTDLAASIRQSGVEAETGFLQAGKIGNLPSGEVFFAPVLGTTNGTLVIDGSIADDVLDEPITIEIHDGIATKFSGGMAAQNLQQKLSQYGKKGLTVAEIGIGTNKAAKISQNLLEAEKAFGTVHVAFGNSSAIGGENNVPIHIDGLVSEPTVWVDDEIVLENRIFKI